MSGKERSLRSLSGMATLGGQGFPARQVAKRTALPSARHAQRSEQPCPLPDTQRSDQPCPLPDTQRSDQPCPLPDTRSEAISPALCPTAKSPVPDSERSEFPDTPPC